MVNLTVPEVPDPRLVGEFRQGEKDRRRAVKYLFGWLNLQPKQAFSCHIVRAVPILILHFVGETILGVMSAVLTLAVLICADIWMDFEKKFWRGGVDVDICGRVGC